MTPEQIAKPGTEHAIQCAVFCWASQNIDLYPQLKWLFAIPNGGERNIIVAGRLKAEGVKSGVSDICLPYANNKYNGLFIEMKKPGGKESVAQKEFGAFLQQNGYYYACHNTWTDATLCISNYLKNNN